MSGCLPAEDTSHTLFLDGEEQVESARGGGEKRGGTEVEKEKGGCRPRSSSVRILVFYLPGGYTQSSMSSELWGWAALLTGRHWVLSACTPKSLGNVSLPIGYIGQLVLLNGKAREILAKH